MKVLFNHLCSAAGVDCDLETIAFISYFLEFFSTSTVFSFFSPSLRWQDIVVGAPQYFDRSGDIGGAVYIYINQRGKWEGIKPIRLNGTADSMFGLAVENVGDINQDGYPGE